MQQYLIHPDLLKDSSKVLELLTYMAEASLAVVVVLYSWCAIGVLLYTLRKWLKKK